MSVPAIAGAKRGREAAAADAAAPPATPVPPRARLPAPSRDAWVRMAKLAAAAAAPPGSRADVQRAAAELFKPPAEVCPADAEAPPAEAAAAAMQPSGGRQGAPEADDHPYMPLAAEPWRFNATVRMGAILCGLAALCAAEAKAAGAAAAVAAAAAPPPWEHPSLLSGAVEWHRSLLDDENGSYAAAEQLAAQAPPESSAWLARWVLHGAASPSVGTCPRATWVAMPAAQRAAAVAFSVPVAHLGDGMLRRLLVAGHLATVGGRGGTETADFVTRSPIRPAEGDNGSGRTPLITVAPGDPFTPELTRAFIRAVAAGAPFAGMRERRPAASMLARMATRVGAGSSVRDWLECANAGGIGGRLIASLSSDVPEGAKQPVWATLTYDPAKPSEPAFDSCATRQMTADLGLAVSARMIDAAIKINSCGRLSAIAGYK